MALLQLENVVSNYGSIKALTNVSFEVNEGEIVTLIGANHHHAHHRGPEGTERRTHFL